MHDQSASRISGQTRAAVSAMCVRALRITVLKSAGNFTRDECHDLNAEKFLRVKCFMLTRTEFVACQQFSNAGVAGWVRKFQVVVNLADVAVCFATSGSTHGSRHQSEGLAAGHPAQASGRMFWFIRKTFFGSYFVFISWRRR
jgi:hypothetical protein